MSGRMTSSGKQALINNDLDGGARELIFGKSEPHSGTVVDRPDGHSSNGPALEKLDALRMAVDALREQLERERSRADRLERARDAEREASAKVEAQLEYERGRVDQAERAEIQLGRLWETAVQAKHEAEAALAIVRATRPRVAQELERPELSGPWRSRLLNRMWPVFRN